MTTLYTVKYTSSPGGIQISCVPTKDREQAKLARDLINAERPSAGAWVSVEDVPEMSDFPPPRCGRCGAEKVSDLFKGTHCPRCNDWV